jgi:hypothetical protein
MSDIKRGNFEWGVYSPEFFVILIPFVILCFFPIPWTYQAYTPTPRINYSRVACAASESVLRVAAACNI